MSRTLVPLDPVLPAGMTPIRRSRLARLPTFPLRLVGGVVVFIVGLFVVYLNHFRGTSNLDAFVTLYVVTFIVLRPRRAISPLTLFYVYYGLWYVIAPLFAELFDRDNMHAPEFTLAFAFAYTVFGFGALCIEWGEHLGSKSRREVVGAPIPPRWVLKWILTLYLVSTLMVVMIVSASGGLARWVADPGDAFLNRAGSGVYVILSHFSSMALALISGYYAYRTGRKWPLVCFIVWLAVTSPVHGSKFQISLLAILLFVPWLKTLRLFDARTVLLFTSIAGIFFLGIYFRNLTWIDVETVLPYALNYFNTLDNLAISLRDFEPQFMFTFMLPFVKFLTPFGIADPSMYYDMNHLLTDIYFPHAWEIRATEQWPVETDLYLNFFFFGGLPLVGLYLFTIGVIYGRALKRNSLGAWFVAIVMTLFMVSHLRGSLLNHTDFHMYPYLAAMYLLLRKVRIDANAPSPRRRT